MFPAMYHRSGDYTDVHMMTSRDGINWERPSKRPVIAGGEPSTMSVGSAYAGHGLISLKPSEFSLPFTPRRATHNTVFFDNSMEEPGVFSATWREDGFMSLSAKASGAFTTLIVDFIGTTLRLNTYTRLGGHVLVEIVDASDDNRRITSPAIPNRSFEDCDPITDTGDTDLDSGIDPDFWEKGLTVADGCGCTHSRGGRGVGWLLFGGLAVLAARRRSRSLPLG